VARRETTRDTARYSDRTEVMVADYDVARRGITVDKETVEIGTLA